MKQKTAQNLFIIVGTILCVFLVSTYRGELKEREFFSPRDLEDILKSGILRAVTEYNAVSYHVSGDTVTGFDYEVLQKFAGGLNVKLELTPEMSFEQQVNGLQEGRYDILAGSLVVNSEYIDSLAFTHPLLTTKYVLVQRKTDDSTAVRTPFDLAGKKIHIVKSSPVSLRIRHLIHEIADTIYVEEVPLYGMEQLIAMVAGGEIDYAVCDRDIAQTALQQHDNIDIDMEVSFSQLRAWGMNKRSPLLLERFNKWLDAYSKTAEYRRLVKKYFKGS